MTFSNLFFVVRKNLLSRRRKSVLVPLQVLPLIVLVSSSLITLVICSTTSSSNGRLRRDFNEDNQNKNDDFLKIRVLHTNDLHSRFDEVTKSGSKCKEKDRKSNMCYGGVARLKYMVNHIRNQHKPDDNVLFLNAGDFFQV